MAADAARREAYIGEKRKFLRNGFGAYVYENQFFRYEGDWKDGKKHGHGKLLMKDGTYYEGQFSNGEINGHGFKYFHQSRCKYTGQFVTGEMHGHGVMQYKDESIYEGQWYKNKKQGFGVLRTSPKSIYEGNFEGHHKNGDGTQLYESRFTSSSPKNRSVTFIHNGDRYEGYWVMDKRHGHGELFCVDGSYYVGQFQDDLYHGDGKMQHASGMLYAGQWLHGFPTRLATKMVLIVEEQPLVIRQGQPFKIAIRCQDDDGNDVLEDQGREIQVTAGFKYMAPKEGSVLFDMIEDVEEKPIPTPFGYDVVSYPLTDSLGEEEVVVEEKADKNIMREDDDEKGEGEGEEEGGEKPEGQEGDEEGGVTEDGALAGDAILQPTEGSNPPSPGLDQAPESAKDGPGALPRSATPVEATPLPPPVPARRTEGGTVEWGNLQLSPPPPLYRPFVALDEEKKSSKKMSLKDKFEVTREELDITTPPLPQFKPKASLKMDARKGSAKKNSINKLQIDKLSEKQAEKPPEKLLMENKTGYPVPDESGNDKRGSQAKLGDLGANKDKTAVADEKFAPTDDDAAKCRLDTAAPTGEYVLMVHDVTSPPFLGKRLDPIFLLLKLKRPKKIIVKKPKWDTTRHIAAAMQSRYTAVSDV